MAKLNIKFNNADYHIDESALTSATNDLKSHLSTTMSGSGATINLGGTSYNIDSTKLSTTTNIFVSHLGTISGSGKKVVINGVEHSIDSNKLSSAVSDLETVFGNLNVGGGDEPEERIAVPNTGYVGNVYFNTDLSIEEVKAILNEAFIEPGVMDIMEGLLWTDSVSIDVSSYFDEFTITLWSSSSDEVISIFDSGENPYYGITGWNTNITYPIAINSNVSDECGTQNDKLLDLFYTYESELVKPSEERLGGDGAEYYTLAPTELSFRSTAPLNELQEIQINGVTVDPSNYTLEEGSTIVTFPIDYLKTLNVGSYEVNVVSESKAVKGDFSVKAPELNEHGFYYNQPYSANLPMFGGYTAFFVREDGTYDIITVGKIPETGDYTMSGNDIVATHPMLGTLHCTISIDGMSIYCNEVATNFTLGSQIFVSDEDYIYTYVEELGGYEVKCIDKTKAEYGAIKTGINGIDTVKLAGEMFAIAEDNTLISNTSIVSFPEIPATVTTIGRGAFYGCQNLTSVEIPNSMANIGEVTFANCRNLVSVMFDGTIAQWNAITKGDGWIRETGTTHVQCTDGQVAL